MKQVNRIYKKAKTHRTCNKEFTDRIEFESYEEYDDRFFTTKGRVNFWWEFVAKENNYWDSPNHYLIVENKVYDIKYELEKGYFTELDKTVSCGNVEANYGCYRVNTTN